MKFPLERFLGDSDQKQSVNVAPTKAWWRRDKLRAPDTHPTMSSHARSSNPRTRRGPSSPRGRGFRPGPSPRPPPKPDFMRGLLPQTHRAIPIPSLPTVDAEVKISDLELIGSYDWVERPVPTIRVPGPSRTMC